MKESSNRQAILLDGKAMEREDQQEERERRLGSVRMCVCVRARVSAQDGDATALYYVYLTPGLEPLKVGTWSWLPRYAREARSRTVERKRERERGVERRGMMRNLRINPQICHAKLRFTTPASGRAPRVREDEFSVSARETVMANCNVTLWSAFFQLSSEVSRCTLHP
ncbi:hypothetical protein KP509_03G031100 [Ceratopteris richardii]|uniref:Uncharacterized protein n=1 Tax=Ceratopteris richardii TaxID=49495 RepID=A0A8T2V2Q2_CERRI|nr:hypothetical protein KP509_03G031100 [Ceratopteris richardii]